MANLATINNNILADSGIDPLSLIVGTGTVNYVPKFTAEDTVANSQIFDNGTGVGIGTTSPSVKLHVVGDILSFGSALFAGTINSTRIVTTADTIQAYWSSEASPRLIAGRDIYVSGQAGIGFGAGNSYAMIGDASATAGTAMGFSVGAPSGSGSSYEKMRITSSGNVGIGTTSPGYTLQVKNSDASVTVSSSDSTAEMRINAQSGLAILETITNTDLRIRTNSTERMRITSGGNVGIGTSAPGGRLDVVPSAQNGINVARAGGYPSLYGSNDFVFETDGVFYFGVYIPRVFSVNSSFYVTAAGNVGIGTGTPTSKLELYNSSGDTRMTVTSTGGTGASDLLLKNASGTVAYEWYVQALGADGRFRIFDNTGGSTGERLTIDQSGNVGIGTSSPSYKLDINGQTRFQDIVYFANGNWNKSGDGFNRLYFANAGRTYFGSGNGYEWRSDGDATLMVLTNGGNVGIGTTSPAYKLQAVVDNSYSTLVIAASSLNGNVTGGLTFGGIYNSDDLNFYSGGSFTEKMRIKSSGLVGIGTGSPSYNLHISSASNETGIGLTSTATGGRTYRIFTNPAWGAGSLQIYDATADVSRISIFSNGNVAINSIVDAGYRLDVNGIVRATGETIVSGGTLYLNNTDNSQAAYLVSTGTGGSAPLIIATNSTERMRITSGGNVGIGTSAPATDFQVVRSGSVTGRFSNTATSVNTEIGVSGGLGYVGTQSANAFGIITSDTERVRITSSGSVGIGTTNPITTLQVNATSPSIRLQETGSGGDKRLELSVNSSGVATIAANQSAQVLTFETVGSERMRIAANGNVGIGTSSPGSIGTGITGLDIQGTNAGGIGFGTSVAKAYVYGSSIMYLDASSSISLYVASAERMRLFSSGAVRFNNYGSGSFTGTRAYDLSVDASGNIIEVPVGAGTITGSGTANYIPKWTSSSAIGNSDLITDGSGNLAIAQGNAPTQALNIYRAGSTQTVMAAGNSNTGLNGTYFGVDSNGNGIINTTGAFANIFSTNGSERMRITGSGNVGIGTTSPEAKLDVFGSSSDQIRLRTAASEYYRIGRNASTGYLDFWGSQSGYVGYTWSGVNGERMRLDSSGNLGLGVVPSAWSTAGPALQLKGTALVNYADNYASSFSTNAYYNTSNQWAYYSSTYRATLYQQADGSHTWNTVASGTANAVISWTQAMTLDASGNLLVGATSTSQARGGASTRQLVKLGSGQSFLEIQAFNTSSDAGLLFANSNSSNYGLISYTSTDAMQFYANSAERMRLNTTGLGIGTSNPTSLLYLKGYVPTITFEGSGYVGDTWQIRTAASGSNSTFNFYNVTQGTYPLNIDGAGRVGIGTTTPAYKLDVINAGNTVARFLNSQTGANADLVIGNGNNSWTQRITGDGTYDYTLINNGTGARVLTALANGNVGIGTTSPATTLDVRGNAQVKPTTGTDAVWNRASNDSGEFYLGIDNSAGSGFTGTAYARFLYATGGYPITLHTNGNERMRINSGGDIWFKGASSSTGYEAAFENSNSLFSIYGSRYGGTGKAITLWATGSSESMRINYTNNVLIGTTTDAGYKLNVNGNAKLGSGTSSLALKITGDDNYIEFDNPGTYIKGGGNLTVSATSNLLLFTGASERMRITSGGLVGIGTSSPSDTLHVTGSVRSNSGSSYEVTNHGTFTLNDGTLGNYVDFLVVGSTNVGSSFVELTLSETNIGHGSIKYFIPTNYDDVYVSQTRVVLPLYTTNPRFGYAGGGYGSAIQELQIIANNTGNYTLRLVVRKVGDGSAPAWYWTAKLKNCAVSSTPNTTGINSTVYSLYRHTPLMQYDNKVGIGTAQPSATLNVVSTGNAAYTCIVTEDNARRLKIGRDQISAYDLTENPAQLYIQGNGSNVAMVTAGGNVGIGTSGPSYKLDVVGTTARVRDAGNVNYVSLSIYGGVYLGGNGTGGVRYAGTETNDNFALVANNSEKVRITTGGYVGIGDTNPQSGLYISKYGSNWDGDVQYNKPTGNVFLSMGYAVANQDNWFGIRGNYGSSSGTANILLQANYRDINSQAGHYIASKATALGAADFEIGKLVTSTSISTPPTKVPQLYITSGGNVGIGTSSPISYSGYTTLALNNATNGAVLDFMSNGTRVASINNNASSFEIETKTAVPMVFSTNGSERMRITSGGIVGIGTSSPDASTMLQVQTSNSCSVRIVSSALSGGDLYLTSVNSGSESRIDKQGTAGPLTFYNNGSERMRLTSSGELLIGTTSDAGDYKLQVNGNGYFNGNLETTVDLVLSRTAVAPAIVTVNGNLRLYKSSGAGAQYSLSYDNDTITFNGSIKTAAPSGGTAATWKLGSRISNTCGLPLAYSDFVSQFMNTNKVIEVEIGGVTVYIPTVTPGWC